MPLTEVYVGLGGNIGDSCAILQQALKLMDEIHEIVDLRVSRFYLTSPVSNFPQDHYVNAVCCFRTSLDAPTLLGKLQNIELRLGKKDKPKHAPRIIDLDLLFFGYEKHQGALLEIPHPRWKERLFVLVPLSDLAANVAVPTQAGEICQVDIKDLLKNFQNIHNETVTLLYEKLANEEKMYATSSC
jgi:2-amino-4-hydroxy-6-hydroxymethyldihydropteridine diphosphokinase